LAKRHTRLALTETVSPTKKVIVCPGTSADHCVGRNLRLDLVDIFYSSLPTEESGFVEKRNRLLSTFRHFKTKTDSFAEHCNALEKVISMCVNHLEVSPPLWLFRKEKAPPKGYNTL
jgi:hypothetical protein